MRKIKMLVVGIVLAAATLVGGMMVAQPVSAADTVRCPEGTVRAGASVGEGKAVSNLAQCNISKSNSEDNLMKTVNKGINLAIAIAGILSVVMIIAGGISMTTSAGDATKVKKAKDTILYGVVGLVITLLAFAIVNFVLTSLFSASTGSDSASDYTTKADCTDAGYSWDSKNKVCE